MLLLGTSGRKYVHIMWQMHTFLNILIFLFLSFHVQLHKNIALKVGTT